MSESAPARYPGTVTGNDVLGGRGARAPSPVRFRCSTCGNPAAVKERNESMMTLKKIRQTTTPEYLGTEATEADVRSYLDLLAQRWPVAENEPVDAETTNVIQTAAFNAWCGAGPAESDSEQE